MAFMNKKPVLIILGFIAALQIALFYYFRQSLESEERAAQASLASQAVMLKSNIEERVAVIKGISSFVETAGFHAAPDLINRYLQSAYASTQHIMNVVVAPGAVIQYVFPHEGNSAIIGKSLLDDPSLSTPGLVRETISSRSITIDGPRMLAQGKYGMVIRQALFQGNVFAGIVSVTLSVDDLISQFMNRDASTRVMTEDLGFLFGSNSGHIDITAPISIYNQRWIMGMPFPPGAKWSLIRGVLWIDLAFLLFFTFLLYTFWSQGRFNRELERLVSIRTRDLQISERLYEKLAYYDSLTEIPNRRYFMDEFERLLQTADPTQTYTLFFFDLNKFKEINDTLGHSAGDQVIKSLAKRLYGAHLPCRMFARTGGDEFVMLFEDLPRTRIPEIADRIRSLAAETMFIAGARLNLSTSIGVSIYPDHSENKEDLLKYADMSMYQAKTQDGTDFFIFDSQLKDKHEKKTMISKYLNTAFERREFVLHYQPQVHAGTGELVGLEALVRWNHPEQGLLGPGLFITAIEEAGLMIHLTDWVIHEVCRQLCEWNQQGLPLLRTSINISNSWFYNRNLVENLVSLLERYGLEARYLEFEITESTALLEEHYPVLQQIRDLGIVVSIDDFGTKYSSLNYLKHFPVNKIKIDRTFITGIGRSPIDETIIKSIVFVASQLGYDLIAEGVETVPQAEFLVAHDCPHIQGFLFYRPMPPGELAQMMSETDGLLVNRRPADII